MKITIASRRSSSLSFGETKRDRTEVKKNVKFSKNLAKEMMTITKAMPIRIIRKANLEEKRGMPFKDMMKRRLTLKELQDKNIRYLIRTCQECWMIFLKRGSFNFQSQKGPKKWEGLLTRNTVVTIGW